ncbi:MAG: hypothetical protein EXR65_01640 [Dehalococcoidia bacterium]|nr:hypothetical protein [Dehalococcoidia bacterium]
MPEDSREAAPPGEAVGRTTPRALIVGPLTLDVFPDGVQAGGPVSYAARAAAALGERIAILTTGGPDAQCNAFAGHDTCFVPAGATLRFEFHDAPDGSRRLRVFAWLDRQLREHDLPAGWE